MRLKLKPIIFYKREENFLHVFENDLIFEEDARTSRRKSYTDVIIKKELNFRARARAYFWPRYVA